MSGLPDGWAAVMQPAGSPPIINITADHVHIGFPTTQGVACIQLTKAQARAIRTFLTMSDRLQDGVT